MRQIIASLTVILLSLPLFAQNQYDELHRALKSAVIAKDYATVEKIAKEHKEILLMKFTYHGEGSAPITPISFAAEWYASTVYPINGKIVLLLAAIEPKSVDEWALYYFIDSNPAPDVTLLAQILKINPFGVSNSDEDWTVIDTAQRNFDYFQNEETEQVLNLLKQVAVYTNRYREPDWSKIHIR